MKYPFVEVVDNVLRSTLKYETRHSSFIDALFEVLRENENKIAMVDCDSGREWTSRQLMDATATLAVRFLELGISKGDVVALFCPNSDFHAIASLSLWSIGAIYTGLYFKSPLNELNRLFTKTNFTYLIGSHETFHVCEEFMLTKNSIIKKFFVIDNRGQHANEKICSIESLLNSSLSESNRKTFFECFTSLKLTDVCRISFSSGTTGEPKPFEETNERMISFGSASHFQSPEMDLITSNDICAVVQTLAHAGGTTFLILSLLKGAKAIIFSHFDCVDFINKVKKYSITFAFIIPSNINLMNRAFSEPLESLPLKKVLVAGEFLHEFSSKEFVEKFKPQFFGQGFGCTEAGWATMVPVSEGVSNLKSSGVPLPGSEIKIASLETGEALGVYQTGEICFKAPQTMKCYLSEQATKDSFDEQKFFKCGDIGYYDENGRLYCTDRIKLVIKYCAHQVSPTELQNILLQHESVKETAVVGIPDEICGELPKAFVVLKDEYKGRVKECELIEFLNEKVADYKKLRGGLKFMENLPKTSLGKIGVNVLKTL